MMRQHIYLKVTDETTSLDKFGLDKISFILGQVQLGLCLGLVFYI